MSSMKPNPMIVIFPEVVAASRTIDKITGTKSENKVCKLRASAYQREADLRG